MSSVIIAGNTSGTITLDAPNVAGTTTLTLPTTTDTLVGRTTTDTLTNKTLTSPVMAGTPTGVGVLTSGTSVASTSGTSIDFTSIPSWVKRITVMFSGVSTNGTSLLLIQLGDSGGIENTNYLGRVSDVTVTSGFSSGFTLCSDNSAASIYHGQAILSLLNNASNLWVESSILGRSDNANVYQGGGSKSLSDTLDRIRITTVNGTDTFDAGSINILFE